MFFYAHHLACTPLLLVQECGALPPGFQRCSRASLDQRTQSLWLQNWVVGGLMTQGRQTSLHPETFPEVLGGRVLSLLGLSERR